MKNTIELINGNKKVLIRITNSLATKNKNDMKTNQATIDTATAIQENATKLRNMQRPHKYSLFPLFSDLPHKEWIFDFAPCKHDLYGYRMNSKK